MDRLSKAARSVTMSRIRGRGNRSTELALRLALVRAGLSGWRLHPSDVVGRPDFWFDAERLAVFVDGCFWHCCSRCRIPIPANNRMYWKAKLTNNKRRDRAVTRILRAEGIQVRRIWEHELRTGVGLNHVIMRITIALKCAGG